MQISRAQTEQMSTASPVARRDRPAPRRLPRRSRARRRAVRAARVAARRADTWAARTAAARRRGQRRGALPRSAQATGGMRYMVVQVAGARCAPCAMRSARVGPQRASRHLAVRTPSARDVRPRRARARARLRSAAQIKEAVLVREGARRCCTGSRACTRSLPIGVRGTTCAAAHAQCARLARPRRAQGGAQTAPGRQAARACARSRGARSAQMARNVRALSMTRTGGTSACSCTHDCEC